MYPVVETVAHIGMAFGGWSLLWILFYLGCREGNLATKRVSAIHCYLAFFTSIAFLSYHLQSSSLRDFLLLPDDQFVGAHFLGCISCGYFILDFLFAFKYHPVFIPHHAISIAGFAIPLCFGVAIPACEIHLLVAETGGIFFHLNELFPSPSFTFLFYWTFVLTRLILWVPVVAAISIVYLTPEFLAPYLPSMLSPLGSSQLAYSFRLFSSVNSWFLLAANLWFTRKLVTRMVKHRYRMHSVLASVFFVPIHPKTETAVSSA